MGNGTADLRQTSDRIEIAAALRASNQGSGEWSCSLDATKPGQRLSTEMPTPPTQDQKRGVVSEWLRFLGIKR